MLDAAHLAGRRPVRVWPLYECRNRVVASLPAATCFFRINLQFVNALYAETF
jgi:hypothetical protein